MRAALSRVWLPVLAVAASLLAHWTIAAVASALPQISPLNDVNLYAQWVDRGLAINRWPGTNEPGVYPLLALVPMILARLFDTTDAIHGWLWFITALDTVALLALVRRPNGWRAGAYWLAFLLLLGPVAIGRIDAVAAALDVFVVITVLAGRERLGMALATAGAWIKIWPLSAALAVLATRRSRAELVRMFGAAAAVSLGVMAVGIALGGNLNMFSFLWLMGDRGIQIESPIALPWMWGAHLGWGDSSTYFDANVITYQVVGPGAAVVSKLMLPALGVALAITAWLGVKAAAVDARRAFVLTSLTAVLDLIVFNKVGSPQFESWLAVPLIAGVLLGLPSWRLPLIGGLAIAALTQWVYPLNYDAVVATEPFALAVLTARNLLLIAMLAWANLRLSSAARP